MKIEKVEKITLAISQAELDTIYDSMVLVSHAFEALGLSPQKQKEIGDVRDDLENALLDAERCDK